MKPLNMTLETPSTSEDIVIKVIPANLRDVSGEVYGDKLYTMYTTSTNVVGTEIDVNIIASDLVKHTASNGIKGYWVGIGIHSSIFEDAKTYVGWGRPNDAELLTESTPDGEQEVDEEVYNTFYFDVGSARKHGNVGYVVVDKNNIHYHFNIDFSQITMKESSGLPDDINWDGVSVQNVKDNYLFGINLSDANGNPLPEGLFVHYINSSIDYLQNLLDIVISDTEFTSERHDYIRSDYQNWGFIQLDHKPVKEVKRLTLMYGNQRSVEIPLDWIQLDKLSGQITLFPSAGSANSLIIGQTGLLFGFQSQWQYAPQLWEVEYVAGVDEKDKNVPFELLKEAVAKRASCGILNVWGRKLKFLLA